MKKEKKSDLDKILDTQMKDLIGTRNWNLWRNDIEPEMYNCIRSAMLSYGEMKWNQAQKEAELNKRCGLLTPFKP